MNPLFHTDFSISDSLKSVRKNVLIYETIIGLPVPIVVYGEKLVRQEECILIMDLETLVQVLVC